MRLKAPCTGCGTPVKATVCDECRRRTDRRRIRKRRKRASPADRGYDQRWRNLSERARRMQPWCLDCGATDDLQADHSPEAWKRWEQGLSIRLKDIDVVCGPCNRKRGQARGKDRRDTSRSKPSSAQNGTDPHSSAEKPPQGHRGWGEAPSRSQARLPLSPTLFMITLSISETLIPGGET